MILLILGVLLWIFAHLMKRTAPGLRGVVSGIAGEEPSKGVMAGLIILSVILMVIGYRSWDAETVYALGSWARHLNNLLMLFAVLFFGLSASKGRSRAWLRHPMLLGFLIWSIAHLLVNGTTADIVLFGGLALWALAEILIINRQTVWVRKEPGTAVGDIRVVTISLVVYVVIALVHGWIGPSPFG